MHLRDQLHGGSAAEKILSGNPQLLENTHGLLLATGLDVLSNRIGSGDNSVVFHVGNPHVQKGDTQQYIVHCMPMLLYASAVGLTHSVPHLVPPAVSWLVTPEGLTDDRAMLRHYAEHGEAVALVVSPYLEMGRSIGQMIMSPGKGARDVQTIQQAFERHHVEDNDVRPEIGYARSGDRAYPWYPDWSSITYLAGKTMPIWGAYDFPDAVPPFQPSGNPIRDGLLSHQHAEMEAKQALLVASFDIYAVPVEERLGYLQTLMADKGIAGAMSPEIARD